MPWPWQDPRSRREAIGYEAFCEALSDVMSPLCDRDVGVRITSEFGWITAKSLDPRVDECPLASPLTRVLRHLGTAGLSDGPTGWWWLPIH